MNSKLIFLGLGLLLLIISFWVEGDAFDIHFMILICHWVGRSANGGLVRFFLLVGGVYFLRNRQVRQRQ